jgi:hypothetical protein
MMNQNTVSLVVSLPIEGEDGEGTLEDLDFRHDLEDALDSVLRQRRLGHVDGGGQGFGYQDVFMMVRRETWQLAWDLVRSSLAEQGLLGRAAVAVGMPDGQPTRQLWPPSGEPAGAL